MRYQRTLKKPVELKGLGLHTGREIHVRILSAPENTGIVFVRTDLSDKTLPALVHHVSPERSVLSTTLADGAVTVQTVEHLMSAANGLYLDNLRVELDGPELPILDGSAYPYTVLFRESGVRDQNQRQFFYTVSKAVEFSEGEKWIRVEPSDHLSVSYRIAFGDRLAQERAFTLTKKEFEREIAQAKTFCFLKDVEKMQEMGLVKGGTLENALVIGEEGVINPEYQTYPDEFVRHKILDFLGDIRLLDRPLVGEFSVVKGGHAFHTRFLSFLIEENLLVRVDAPVEETASWHSLACPLPIG